ncbi:MAG TPA: GMC family oxidoreductase [Acetobacteraceae bacterium]|nr:GMC family oxidoreductase [Acetobacteraceae bacterium]
MDFDAIVIGSGFGGSVAACRLAESGARVLVLERGRRWDRSSYPSVTGKDWFWSQQHPDQQNGWIDLRVFPHMAVAQGAAVGGGSLIYANISAVPPQSVFESGWPSEITHAELAPHYATVGTVMNVQKVPDNQWTPRMHLVRDAAQAIGAGDRFRQLELAVTFDPDFDAAAPNRCDAGHTRWHRNDQGIEQGTCVHCGNCDIGCPVDAKNTLDRTYLALAETKGAEVRPLHLVTAIEPDGTGWRVRFDRLDARQPDSAAAAIVVLAGGSLNSTELLLRCRDVLRTLPAVSQRLGCNWSSNGDFLTPAFYLNRQPEPSFGPTITCAVDFFDRSRDGQSFWIQDGGFPNLLANLAGSAAGAHPTVRLLLNWMRTELLAHAPLDRVMPWFAQGVDAADGQLRLRRSGADWELTLDWDIARSRALMDAIVEAHKALSRATGGTALVPPSWSLLHYLITPHPLGGCPMGSGPENGVVDHRGEVFGYRNLFVLDGSIVPRAAGVNPSRTIAALAERAVHMISTAHG